MGIGDSAAGEAAVSICDVSGLRKLGVKGGDAEDWLSNNGIYIPAETLGVAKLSAGGFVARIGEGEFFLEDGVDSATLPHLASQIDDFDGEMYGVEHQEATIVLSGPHSHEVMRQTCGVDFNSIAPDQIVFTRVAGVSCSVLPDRDAEPVYRVWVDPSYAVYLWETLVEIVEDLGGAVVGADRLYSQLRG
ncbi:MAG: hypothetical protein QGG36_22465 [Pirellulaceae bacterium]|nr:hypothetical protein [Pirellulaceae bacterium]